MYFQLQSDDAKQLTAQQLLVGTENEMRHHNFLLNVASMVRSFMTHVITKITCDHTEIVYWDSKWILSTL